MKFCQEHWDKLKVAIEVRGMWELVAPSGQAAIYRMEQELKGNATDSNYDPLMAAHNMISAAALQNGGLYLLTGEFCPLCELKAHVPQDLPQDMKDNIDQEWINGATDAVKLYVQEHKLLGSDES